MAHRLGSTNETDRCTCGESTSEAGNPDGVGRRSYIKVWIAGVVGMLVGSSNVAAASPHPSREDPTKRILIRPRDGVTRYEITVDGRIRPGADTARDASARISGSSTEGIVTTDDRRYRFEGELQDLSIEGDAGVYVGTERIDPE